jgi:hypothetical protein
MMFGIRYSEATFRIDEHEKLLNHACELLWPKYHQLVGKMGRYVQINFFFRKILTLGYFGCFLYHIISCVEERHFMVNSNVLTRMWTLITRKRFSSLRVNRHHEQYNASNIWALDVDVYRALEQEAKVYGFKL